MHEDVKAMLWREAPDEAQALTRVALALARDGDPVALRLCLDRIIAPRRERAVRFAMPPITGAADLVGAMAALALAAAQGIITPGEAAQLSQVVETYIRAIETTELEPTRAAIVRLGAEAAAALAEIPDTPQLAAGDRAFVALYPLDSGKLGGPIVGQMRRLVERYRDECGIDRLILHLTIAEAYA